MGSGQPGHLHALVESTQVDLLYHQIQAEEGARELTRRGISLSPAPGEEAGPADLRAFCRAVPKGLLAIDTPIRHIRGWHGFHMRSALTAARWKDLLRHLPSTLTDDWDGRAFLTDRYTVHDWFLRLGRLSYAIEQWLDKFTEGGRKNGKAQQLDAVTQLELIDQPGVLILIGTLSDGTPICERFTQPYTGTPALAGASVA